MNKSAASYVLLFMLAMSVVFGTGISAVHHATLETLAQNERLHKNRVMARAFLLDIAELSPEALQKAVDRSIEVEIMTHNGRDFEVLTGKGPVEGRVGFVFSGLGFWGPIKGIVVLSADLKTTVNIQFLEQEETPGLGARIEEPWFTDQFKQLEIGWKQSPEARIVIGRISDSKLRNRVDAITGATQTCMALMESLNRELGLFRQAYAKRETP